MSSLIVVPTTVNELVQRMRKYVESYGTKNIQDMISYLNNLTEGGIRMHYDIIGKNRAQNSTHPLSGCANARLVLTYNKNHQGEKLPIHYAANGVIVKFPEWNVLSVMPNMTETQYNKEKLAKTRDQYDVYPLLDGTTVALYYDDGWKLSSCNSHNVSDYTFIGEKTFRDAIDDLVKQYTDFSFEKLDKKICYVLRFKHPHFHPFSGDSPYISLIHTVSFKNGLIDKIDNSVNIGLPCVTAVDVSGEDLFKDNDDAVNEFKKTHNVKYGFLLRARGGSKTYLPDVIIETKLMTYIRKTIYDIPNSKTIAIQNPTQRVDYITLRAYMIQDFNKYFTVVFPIYASRFQQLKDMFERMCDTVIHCHRDNRRGNSTDPMILVSRVLYNQLSQVNLNINSQACRSIIFDHITNINNIELIYNGYLCEMRNRSKTNK